MLRVSRAAASVRVQEVMTLDWVHLGLRMILLAAYLLATT